MSFTKKYVSVLIVMMAIIVGTMAYDVHAQSEVREAVEQSAS